MDLSPFINCEGNATLDTCSGLYFNINTLLLNNNMIKDKDIFNIITQFNMDNNLKGIIYI